MSELSFRSCRPVAVAFVLLLAAAIPALAQLQTGDIYIKVQDEKGQPLPGATVTVSGIGAPRVETSNHEGQARFVGLHPGQYAVKGELEGFSGVDYPDISVTIGGKAQLVLTLSSSIKETITVTADAPLLDERKVNRGVVINAKELDNVPTARDPWSLLAQAPGVQTDRINVGGNESGQQSDFVGAGSNGRDNTFAVDGVIVSDMNAVGGSATYFDFGAYDEVQFTVSSADVTVATSGVTVNQVTKRGTNQIKANARYLRTDGNLQSAPGTVVRSDGTSLPGNKINSVQEYGGDVGGPLWRDHLWGWVSYGRSDIKNIVVGGQPDNTLLKDFNSKLNFQASDADSGVLHYWTNNKLKDGRNAGPGFAPAATWDQTTPSKIWKLEDTYLLGQNLYFTGLWSNNDGAFTLTPKGGLSPFIFVDGGGTINGTYLDFQQTAITQQERLDGNYFFNTGAASNELKFGGSYRHQDNRSSTVWPHGYEVQDCHFFGCDTTVPNLVGVEFFRNRKVNIRGEYASAWAQDTWALGNWTVNAGARLDDQLLKNRAAFGTGTPIAQGLIPDVSFPGNDAGGFAWRTVVPRIGVTYAVGKERKTLLRGTFSQYAEQLGELPLATRANPIGYSYAYFTFVDANGNHQLDPNEIPSLTFVGTNNIDPNNPASLATPSVNDRNLKPARTNELTAGIDQGLGRDYLFTFTLTYRRIDQIPEERLFVTDQNGVTRLATANDYTAGTLRDFYPDPAPGQQTTFLLPNGKTVLAGNVPVYTLNSNLTPTGGTLYTNGDRTQRYLGGTLTFTKRLSDHWLANAHFTLSDWTWHLGPDFRLFADPTSLVYDNTDLKFATHNGDFFEQSSGSGNKSDVIIGSRWSYHANAMYQVAPDKAWGFDVVGAVSGRQGYPTPPYVNVPGPVGTRHVLLAQSVTEFRNPNIFVLDGRIGKDFKLNDFGLTIGLDGFNLLNNHSVLQRQRNTAVTTAEDVEEVLSPRIFRVGATLHFR
jgi:outer membrane receptor protein involved in Fe transport